MTRPHVPIALLALLVLAPACLVASPAKADEGVQVFQGSGSISFGIVSLCGITDPGSFRAVVSGSTLVSFAFIGQASRAEGVGNSIQTQWGIPLTAGCPQESWLLTSLSADCPSGSFSLAASPASSQGGGLSFSGSGTCSEQDVGLCFAYTPQALTNACIELAPTTENVPVPTVGTTPTPETVPIVNVGTTTQVVCIIGPECVTVPVPVVTPGSTTVTVPAPSITGFEDFPVTVLTPSGYVELTAACSLNVPCRVTL